MAQVDIFIPPRKVGDALPSISDIETLLNPLPAPMRDEDVRTVMAVVDAGSEGSRAGRSTVRLRAVVGLIPDVSSFCALCVADLQALPVRNVRERSADESRVLYNRIATWRRVFSHFARLRAIPHDIAIRAEDDGDFTCELVRPVVPKEWERFFAAGQDVGVPYADLMQVYRRSFRMRGNPRNLRRAAGARGTRHSACVAPEPGKSG